MFVKENETSYVPERGKNGSEGCERCLVRYSFAPAVLRNFYLRLIHFPDTILKAPRSVVSNYLAL